MHFGVGTFSPHVSCTFSAHTCTHHPHTPTHTHSHSLSLTHTPTALLEAAGRRDFPSSRTQWMIAYIRIRCATQVREGIQRMIEYIQIRCATQVREGIQRMIEYIQIRCATQVRDIETYLSHRHCAVSHLALLLYWRSKKFVHTDTQLGFHLSSFRTARYHSGLQHNTPLTLKLQS